MVFGMWIHFFNIMVQPIKYNLSLQNTTASYSLGSAFSEKVEDAQDDFEKKVLSSLKETDATTLFSDKVSVLLFWKCYNM